MNTQRIRIKLSLFAVREVNTGKYFPALPKGNARGSCHQEPEFTCNIRFFRSRRAAQGFIAAWKRGKFFRDRSHVHHVCLSDPFDDGYHEEIRIEEVPERRSIDLEVVEFIAVEQE